ncbi:CaiB/BaiF CoA transferase family protein [Roseomonas haemaphysalidis]|uniref:CoA transferase n=1 Tax=Roseomonas haemaphysalidis TaxID=2768162 RepID=A0ABS3KV18_9PROT|nr:CoA transferase [Roseomonas haemaphysalidis]MBO1081324.1 CoA transferase [Roseomonas haemaphysalidis]
MDGPLAGLRVLDLSSVILGPMTGQYLGDMGADVIKVEAPEGDITRQIGPRRSARMGALFMANNRNKRSLVLDLKNPAAGTVLRRMARQSDVLLHSIRSSAAARLGLGYDALAAANPRLVFCHVTGFSDLGPYAGRPAYDDIIQALSGLAALQTVAAGEPRYVPSIMADKITAVHAAWAIALALFQRERTGLGQQVSLPMLETMVAFNAAEHLGGAVFEPPVGRMGYDPIRQGLRRPFRTADGYLCFLPYNDAHWRRFFQLAGHPEMAEDPGFATLEGRQKDLDAVWRRVGELIRTRGNAEWLALFEGSDVPFSVVNELEDLLEDPHLMQTGFWQMMEHPTEGMLRLPAIPIGMSAARPAIRLLPPRLGEHTGEVLAEFGLSTSEIAELAAAGAFGPPG